MRRWLVTGAGGMLGRDLVSVLDGQSLTALSRVDLDITDAAAVREAVAGHDVVLNAAGWTDVDGAEAHEAEATLVNGTAVSYLAEACAAAGATLVHVSTDYVFPGTATGPIAEDAPVAPVNAYGRSKLAGERAALASGAFVVRTAWLYGGCLSGPMPSGPDKPRGRNFVTTMLRLAGERDTIEVVDDQFGQPTWSFALARRLVELAGAAQAGRAAPGIYHGTASGSTTWYGLARAVFALRGLDPARIRPVASDEFVGRMSPRPARRPAYSVLGHDRWSAAGLAPLADWHDMLTSALYSLSREKAG